jgi:hypothetical protein
MAYFSLFPTFLARLDGTQKVVEDFFVRVAAGKNYISSSVLLLSTYILDGERPEDVAYRYYQNQDYHWVVLLVNNIVDPRTEWPLADKDVPTHTMIRYGSLTEINHYRTVNGKFEISGYKALLDQNVIESVTHFQYEQELNEAKRNIKVLDPQFLNEFVTEFQHLVTT